MDSLVMAKYCRCICYNVLSIGESPSICPFLKNNGDEASKGPSSIIFRKGQIRGLSLA